MNPYQRIIASLPNRDSAKWTVGLVASLLVGLTTTLGLEICGASTKDPEYDRLLAQCAADPTKFTSYGIKDSWVPTIRLVAWLSSTISAFMKTSPRPHSEYGRAKMTPEDQIALARDKAVYEEKERTKT